MARLGLPVAVDSSLICESAAHSWRAKQVSAAGSGAAPSWPSALGASRISTSGEGLSIGGRGSCEAAAALASRGKKARSLSRSASRLWIPTFSSLRRKRFALACATCGSWCRRARYAQAPSVDRIHRGITETYIVVVTVRISSGRPSWPYIRIARPTACTKVLGHAGMSASMTRRTEKKLTPSPHCVLSAMSTR